MDFEEKKTELNQIRQQILACQNCPLAKTRNIAVPGEGDYQASVMFIGEAPGANENEKGIPFCGAAGKFLDEMLNVIGLDRESVFITNMVKCRPPENRDPEDEEKSACTKNYLQKQIELIDPMLIICLGRHSLGYLLPVAGSISQAHGKVFKKPNGRYYLPLYHPAAALHNGGLRETLVNDFKKIPVILKKIENNISKNDQTVLRQTSLL